MSEKNLMEFLQKIDKLNSIAELIKTNPKKKLELSRCNSHEEVIKLTKSWGFDISKRWGE
tara:strand:+ start:1367 stop:1546 length:180 start_codon:yes stop_codon:yes gene_type:complete